MNWTRSKRRGHRKAPVGDSRSRHQAKSLLANLEQSRPFSDPSKKAEKSNSKFRFLKMIFKHNIFAPSAKKAFTIASNSGRKKWKVENSFLKGQKSLEQLASDISPNYDPTESCRSGISARDGSRHGRACPPISVRAPANWTTVPRSERAEP